MSFWNLIKISNSLKDVTACFHQIFFWLFVIKYWPKYKKQKIVCLIFYFNTICKRYTVTKQITYFFYKQLGSGLNPQSCLFFQVAWGLKLLNGCLLVWPSNLCLQEYSNFEDSRPIFKISDFNFLPKMLLRQLNFGAFIGLTAISCLLQRKNSAFL